MATKTLNIALDEKLLKDVDEAVKQDMASLIEALGYPDILAAEERRIKELFDTIIEIPLNASIIQTAVQLRQLKRMSLSDAIVAATALENDCVLLDG